MRIINSDISDVTNNNVTNKFSSFITSGLNLAVNWQNIVTEVVVLEDQDSANLKITLTSLANTDYKITILPKFTTTWDVASKAHVVDSYPDPKVNISFIENIRNMRHKLKPKDLCDILSHAVVWNYCVQVQHPVIVIESGATLSKSLHTHIPRNSIINLTNKPIKTTNFNWKSFQGTSCYSVDQFVCKQLLSYLYTQGIRDDITTMIRDDLFCICEI
jgi:hypothetical protein